MSKEKCSEFSAQPGSRAGLREKPRRPLTSTLGIARVAIMSRCFLHSHGSCGGKISGEHYISETVLEAIGGNGSVQIGGLPWQPEQMLKSIGIKSLVSNVLCETHNSGLSNLDNIAGTFFRALNAADKRPADLPPVTTVHGSLIERWFLKVMCGLAAGVSFNKGTVPTVWCQMLTGEVWPEGWGLYVPTLSGPQVLATEFYIETLVNPKTRDVKAAKFRVAGMHFSLLLGRPDDPASWGTYRPRGLIIRNKQCEKRIELAWPFETNQAVIYTKVGTSKAIPSQWQGWKE